MNQEVNKMQFQILKAKIKLSALDYYTNKYIEGDLSVERWKEVVDLRKQYRKEINELEKKLQEVTNEKNTNN